jgi:hypothetical protein
VRLLHELGHEVFSPGAYVEPRNPGDASLRPGIPGLEYSEDVKELWHLHECKHTEVNGKYYLSESPELLELFDCVIVMHIPDFITKNWEALRHKRTIWRTIGQSIASTEAQMAPYRQQGLEIIRYSPKERSIPGYVGEDVLIRFYKDPDDYGPWTGEQRRVITFAQSMRQRGTACNFDIFERATRPFARHLFGPGNEELNVSWASGKIPFEQLQTEMRTNRVYFYTGTHPASYTLNFIEALMTGMPVVALGPQHGNAKYFANHDLYEVHELLCNGLDGFVADDVMTLQSSMRLLLANDVIAQTMSQYARDLAIKLFGKEHIKAQWKQFLGE